MHKGDVILIIFPFTDLSGKKLRPAMVLAETQDDVTVIFITTKLKWKEDTDVLIIPEYDNGLKMESLLRVSKIATLDKSLVQGRLGFANAAILNEVDAKLVSYLKLR